MTENFGELFAQVREFEWDPKKRVSNLRKHKIDFRDVVMIFDDVTFVHRSDRNEEIRYQIFGYVDGREIAVACTLRGTLCRIISARRARRDERRKFYGRLAKQSSAGQD